MIVDPFPTWQSSQSPFKHCGRCGHLLNPKHKKDADTGFCLKCRKPPPAGQLELPFTLPVQTGKQTRKK